VRIGIIGAGMIGSTMTTLWARARHDVLVSSRHPEDLQALVTPLAPHASAGTPLEAATFGEVVMLTVPLKAVPELARELGAVLRGKIVIDTGNAYARRDGEAAADAARHPGGSAGWAAEMFPGARWVKAFNTVYFKTLESETHRAGDRVGIPLASDDAEAMTVVAGLVRDAGFDPVVAGPLAHGKSFEPDTPPYNTGMSGADLRALLGLSG
jgi:hypothetical protein